MGNYVNVIWSDGYEGCYAKYNFNLVRVSGVDVSVTEDSVNTYVDYTPNIFTDDALLSLVDTIVNNTKIVEETHAKSELAEIQPNPALYFGFDLAEGLEDLKERELDEEMGFFDYEGEGDSYTRKELTKEYLPKDKVTTCLGVEIKYIEKYDSWTLPNGSSVRTGSGLCSSDNKPVLIDGMEAAIRYLIKERTK